MFHIIHCVAYDNDKYQRGPSRRLNSHCELGLGDSNLIFSHDTADHDDAPSFQVWLRTASWFARYLPDKTKLMLYGQTDGRTQSSFKKYSLGTNSDSPLFPSYVMISVGPVLQGSGIATWLRHIHT